MSYVLNSYLLKKTISCRWQTRAMRRITAIMLQTKVDAQRDKLGTKLSWQRLQTVDVLEL